MLLCPLLHGQINFTDRGKETAKPSSCHSYRSSFKRQVITLPSHGQNTAAVKAMSQGRRDLLYWGQAGGDVFGKQARLVFAEFLLLLYVFPLAHQCGANGFVRGRLLSRVEDGPIPSARGTLIFG